MTDQSMSRGGDVAAVRADAPGAGTAVDDGRGTAGRSEDVSWKENALGGASTRRVQNVSWGAIFAGTAAFLAIVLLFSLLTTATGLAGSGVGASIVSIIGVLLGFFTGGAIAGILAVRGGLVHGFLTWALSLIAAVVLLVLLTLGAAGAVGGVLGSLVDGLGSAVGPSLTQVQPSDVPTPGPQQTQAAQQTLQQAQQAAAQAADATQTGAIWGFVGLLIGAIVASLAGLFGSRNVNNRRTVRERTADGRG